MEHDRAKCFSQLLQGPLTTAEQLTNLGELFFQVNAAGCSGLPTHVTMHALHDSCHAICPSCAPSSSTLLLLLLLLPIPCYCMSSSS